MAASDFFNRWRARKPAPAEPDTSPPDLEPAAAPAAQNTQPAPLPTLEDVQRLTPDADFQPFVSRQVAPEVRNAAMRKLFSDPHFNVMDRMDIYIDDYGKADPLPLGMLQQMHSAKFMEWLPSGDVVQPLAVQGGEDAHPASLPNVAQSDTSRGELPWNESPSLTAESPRDDPSLRLQQDPAAEPPGLGPKPE